jgi:histidine triad (HIT) family protein
MLVNKRETVHVVFEDDYVCCILDHNPYNEGHVLILPKKHIRYFDELEENIADSVFKAIKIISKTINKLYNPDGITVCQNGGAFDELTHLHIHIVPRYEGQKFADFYMENGETIIEDKNTLDMITR